MDQNQGKNTLREVIGEIGRGGRSIRCAGLTGSARAYAAAEIHRRLRRPLVVIVPSPKAAERFMEDLRFFLDPAGPEILYFPPYNILPFKFLSYHNETAAQRMRTLYRLIEGEAAPIVVAPVEGLLKRTIPRSEVVEWAELVMSGEEIDRDGLIRKLVSGGYARAAVVEEPGDFCVRGGVLDIFSPLYDDPLRLELFGDVVDSLRFFSIRTQRTVAELSEAVIVPAREVILRLSAIDEVIQRVRQGALAADRPVDEVKALLERIRDEGAFPGIESLMPLIYPELDTFFDFPGDKALFLLDDPPEIAGAAKSLWEEIDRHYDDAADGQLRVSPESLYLRWEETLQALGRRGFLACSPFPTLSDGDPAAALDVRDTTDLRMALLRREDETRPFAPLAAWTEEQRDQGRRIAVAAGNRNGCRRLKSLLEPYGIETTFSETVPALSGSRSATLVPAPLSSGFVWPDEGLAVLTHAEIFGSRAAKKRAAPRPAMPTAFAAAEDLKQGEIVVHVEHGIGRYEGLVKLTLDGAVNDFLLIAYRDDDKLYLPVDRMTLIQKYMGMEGITPVLDKMGGKSWEKVKARVKRSVEQIAGELLKLYAARKVRGGHAYGDPDAAFQEFVADFPYEETPDQQRAIEEVLRDMEAESPMDRLVCGDVGYGKTEVALRAAFVAVNDGKQVAVLVPTTVLAEQHYATFASRFENFAVRVECLSRFRSPKEQRAILQGLRDGRVDIVIGTHRLLQKDVAVKDLGLVILDEEQRFGVKHKEKLKQLRSTVDVLALTATPIPRTLHMSLMGVRDISVISTPPEARRSIITYISELDDTLVADAIRRELRRGGQMYFVHNNIHSIEAMAAHLKRLVPEARLDIAHGRMDENGLEEVMLRFLDRSIDLLVCTTIIEAGLDVPTANTILVNRADRFGLSQIYQLRGRVGRADEQAYAYLFIPNETTLTKDAQKRLKVLMEHSDLGSGFQIAMNDLKIRGGGTILGASQSGHIAAVGYDMFLKLMENAVAELKGEPVIEDLEPEINVNFSAYLAQSYIPDIDQRLTAYRRLARMTDLKAISDYKAELADRFGPLPQEAVNLLMKIMLKVLAIRAGVKRLDLTDQGLALHFSESHQKNPFGIVDLVAESKNGYSLSPDHVFRAAFSGGASPVAKAKNLLKEISQRVNA